MSSENVLHRYSKNNCVHIINRFTSVRTVASMTRKTTPIHAQELLQQIHSRGENEGTVSLMFPEAVLFPEKFSGTVNGAPLGAMTNSMMMNVFGNKSTGPNHVYVLPNLGCIGWKVFSLVVMLSVAVLAELSVSSPRKLFIFII